MRPAGFHHTDATKAKIKAALEGRTKSAEHRTKIAVSVSKAHQPVLAQQREEATDQAPPVAPSEPSQASRQRIAVRPKSAEHRAKIAKSVARAHRKRYLRSLRPIEKRDV